LARGFPVQVPTPQIGLASPLGNFGSALGLLGGVIGLFGDADPAVGVPSGVFGLVGGGEGVFSDAGANIASASVSDNTRSLHDRFSVLSI